MKFRRRIQLKHLRNLAREPSLLVFHAKGLPAEKHAIFRNLVLTVRAKYPDDKSDAANDWEAPISP